MKTSLFVLPLALVIFSFSARSQCVVNADCNDGIACTADVCNAPNCVNTPSNALCNDNISCTTDVCNISQCTHTANNNLCNDNNSCNGTETCDIVQGCKPGIPPSPVNASVSIVSSPLMPFCNGAGQTITFTATPINGGTPSYQWKRNGNNVGSNSPNYASATLVNGDQIWCVMTSTVACVTGSPATSNKITVSMPASNLSASITAATDRGCLRNGTATVTATGGFMPYTYHWSSGANTPTATGLDSIIYNVTVTDSVGCRASTSVDINAVITVVNVTVSVTPVSSCSNVNGAAAANVTGTNPPYSYRWSNGGNTQTILVSTGNYWVTTTDAGGCIAIANGVVAQQPILSATVSQTNPDCHGNLGTITIIPNGGQPPYTITWGNGSTSTSFTRTGLPSGAYDAYLKDSFMCSRSICVYLQPPMTINANITSVSRPLCNGDSNGSLTLNLYGGTPPFTYLWSNGATTKDINNLSTGQYSVTVTDTSGCTATASTNLSEPDVFTGTVSTFDLRCFGSNDGSAVLWATGGTFNDYFSVLWSNGATGWGNGWYGGISDLAAGTYCATATDANGCTFSACGTVNEPAEIIIAASANPPLIQLGESSTLIVAGCTGCTYLWSPPTGLNNVHIQTPVASPLQTTTYSVVATSGWCTATADVTVTVEAGLVISGIVRTETGALIPGVLVDLIGTFSSSDITMPYPTDGQYSVPAIANDDYIAIASKDNDIDAANGITTLDILRIRSHILGNLLTSPYKLIAADVNESGTITTVDLLQVRALVLGNSHTFSSGRLWTFVNSDFVFPNPQQPFPYDDFRGFLGLTSSQVDQDFIGIKFGDVNNSWNPAIPKTEATGNVQFSIDEYAAMPGNEITVPVKVKDFNNVTGYQFTLSWDAGVLSLLEVSNKELSGYYGEKGREEGYLTTSWNDDRVNATSLKDDETVFELKFKVIGAIGTQSDIKIGSEFTASEAYNGNLDLLNIVPTNGMVKVGDNNSSAQLQSPNTLSVHPNPFTNSTNIIFTLPQDAPVSIVIYDLLGKEIKHFEGSYTAGSHQLEWAGDDDAEKAMSAGLYHVRMLAGEGSRGLKVILTR